MIPNSIMWAIWPLPTAMLITIGLVKYYKKRHVDREWRLHRLHKQAELRMDEAFLAGRPLSDYRSKDRSQKSKLLYFQTAILEEKAALLTKHPLSKGILYRSAAWCAIHAGDTARAIRLAEAGLAGEKVPGAIREELEEALEAAKEYYQ